MANAQVWLNGHLLGSRPYGYIGFGFDLTPFLRFGTGKNVLAVRLTPEDHSSRNTGVGRFITFFYGLLDAEQERLVYANAGHNAPILQRRDGTVIRLEEGGAVLGIFPDRNYEEGEVQLNSGDSVLLFTDGVTEVRNAAKEEFGEERLIGLLAQNREFSAVGLQKRLLEAVKEFSPGNFQDDATLVVMSVR